MTFQLIRETETGLLTVVAMINNTHRLKLILDTGATVTTIDSNVLYMSGFRPEESGGTTWVETASGLIETDLYELETFRLFGITHEHFVVQAYDFLTHGIVSDYNGLLGIDFFEGYSFCIDMVTNELSISKR
jgi:Aspartyl protease